MLFGSGFLRDLGRLAAYCAPLSGACKVSDNLLIFVVVDLSLA